MANISGTDQATDKWKMVLSTTIFSTFEENLVYSCPLTKKWPFDLWPMTLRLDRIRAVVKVHVHAKIIISSSWVQRFISYRANKFFALSCNGKKIRKSGHVALTDYFEKKGKTTYILYQTLTNRLRFSRVRVKVTARSTKTSVRKWYAYGWRHWSAT